MQQDIYDTGIRLLSRREHSRLELKRKLLQRGFIQADIEEVLDRLVQTNYLSDERFSQSYLRYRAQQGYGWTRIQNELRTRGVSAELITSAYAANQEEIDWGAILTATWEKKFAMIPNTPKERAKQMRFLLQRGFNQHEINHLWQQEEQHEYE